MTVYFLLRAIFSSTVQHLIRSALQGSSDGLHGRFALLISCVYDFLDGLTRDSSNTPLSTLVDDVLSLVYRQRRFEAPRGQLSSLLMGQQAPGLLSTALNRLFCMFKTQVLQYDQLPLSRAPFTRRNPLQSAWSRRWLLEPGSVKLSDGISGNQWGVIPPLRVVDVAQFIRECGCVDVELESDMSCLAIRSALSVVEELSSVAMELVLDGRLRTVSKLPNGLVAAVGWSFSDYAASFSDGGQSLDLDLFAFSDVSERGVILRRIRLSMSLEQQLTTQVLSCSVNPTNLFVVVQGDISGAMYQPRGFGDDFSKLPIQERVAMYESLGWTPLMRAQAGYITIPERSTIVSASDARRAQC
ncbi:hypothetical protein V7S43_002365 [Phytophthora oleae]|uniref:Uncharacterized protein n=1 Tax=Phytophthora oleae TaxID=2107226 RepID=A0ABD3G4Y8_9STRA